MQLPSDAQLLRDYAERHAENAFAELVQRYTDLVYSAALRQVYSPELARDVTQSVFTDLARKALTVSASLSPEASLIGWLYRGTRFAARDLYRNETRRTRRERQAMEQLQPTAETPPDWERLGPVLDDAMSELDDLDRDAVLLRYFKNHDLRTVGATLGISDDAAQKRVSRAVERLREIFAKRSVTIGASGLAVVLSANAVQAAPAELALTISTTAALTGTTLATTATVTATKTIAMTALNKTVVFAALTVMIGVAIYLAKEITRAHLTQRSMTERPIGNSADRFNLPSWPQKKLRPSQIAPTQNASAPQKPDEASPLKVLVSPETASDTTNLESEFVTFFKQAINSPPEIESFAARRTNMQMPDRRFFPSSSSNMSSSVYFEGALSGTNYLLWMPPGPNSLNGLGILSGRSGTTSYQIGGQGITYGVGSSAVTDSVDAEFRVARQILCFGAGALRAGTVKWNGNYFIATNIMGKPVHGSLEVSNDLPFKLEIFLGDGSLPYSVVRYFYETSANEFSGYPSRFLIFYKFQNLPLVPLAEVEFNSVVLAKQSLGTDYFSEERFTNYFSYAAMMWDTKYYTFLLENGQVETLLLKSNRFVKIGAE